MAGRWLDEDEFREWLRRLMRQRGWTQQKVADHFNVSAPYLSDVINGRRPPSRDFMEKLGGERVVGYRVPPMDDVA